MNPIDKINDLLFIEGFDTELSNHSIKWRDAFGAKCSIISNHVVSNGETIAWFQDNEVGKCFIRILYRNNTTYNWQLSSGHPEWGFRCNFIRWFDNKLIIIYEEKHSHYLVKIENFNIDILFIGYITEIYLSKENIFYIKKMDSIGIIHRISLKNETSLNAIPEGNVKQNLSVEFKKIHDFTYSHQSDAQ